MCGCWESNLGTPQEHRLLVTPEPSLQAQFAVSFISVCTLASEFGTDGLVFGLPTSVQLRHCESTLRELENFLLLV